MDAYSSYILQIAEARLNDLRREAAQDALSRAARADRVSRWAGIRSRFTGRTRPDVEPVVPVPLPQPYPEEQLRRTA